jgi:CrcB protein
MDMGSLISVGIGGFIGACVRYLITKATTVFEFPFGTLLSNVLAGFCIGLIIGIERNSSALPGSAKLFLTTGLLGGLSTFSTFSLETVRFLETGRHVTAIINVGVNVGLSLLCVFAGLAVAKLFVKN